MEQHLLEAVSDGVATLTLNRPERLNALSTPIMDGMLEALPRLARDSAEQRAPGGAAAAGPATPALVVAFELTAVSACRTATHNTPDDLWRAI